MGKYALGKSIEEWQEKAKAGNITRDEWYEWWKESLCIDLCKEVKEFIRDNWTAIANAYDDKYMEDLRAFVLIRDTMDDLNLYVYGRRIEQYTGYGEDRKIDEIFREIAAESLNASTYDKLCSCANDILLYCALKYSEIKKFKLDVEKIKALKEYIKNLDTNATIEEIENFCDELNKKGVQNGTRL